MSVLEKSSPRQLLTLIKRLIPPLQSNFHKGQAGRIAVIGGSEDYTGAPYFSALASTLVGADMAHVICEKSAGPIIKGYSPNIIVHPYLFEEATLPKGTSIDDIVGRVKGILERVHVIVIGPGLGRDKLMLDSVAEIIGAARKRQLPIVIDGDGLFLIQNKPELIHGYSDAVLTPNVAEYARLCRAVDLPHEGSDQASCAELSRKFGNVTILQKAGEDHISDGSVTLTNPTRGGLKRVSGQGDTLTGALATFLAWKLAFDNGLWDTKSLKEDPVIGKLTSGQRILLAAFAASSITRTAAHLAFESKGRSMLTSDLSDRVGPAFDELFGQDKHDSRM